MLRRQKICVNATVSGADSVATLSIAANEPPPPYTPTGHGCIPMINCKVCQAMINLQGRMNQHVVTCGACNEATVCQIINSFLAVNR